MNVTELCDRAEIADVLVRYTRAIDSGDWAALAEVFTPDARIDYTSAGGIAGGRDEITAWLADVLPKYPRRQHVLGQLDIRIDGDRATTTAYFLNPMTTVAADGSEGLYECGGYYHHVLVRTAEGWRSRELVEQTVWTR